MAWDHVKHRGLVRQVKDLNIVNQAIRVVLNIVGVTNLRETPNNVEKNDYP